jgi:crotonobetaine/carnitine-CoA ligase
MYKLELNDIADRHLGRMLELQAKHNGATIFLINDEQRISFAEAEALSNRLASGFHALGIGKGDRVCFFMGNLPEMVLMCLALNKLGAIWVPICTDYKGDWLLQTIQRSEPALLVTDREHSQRLGEVLDHFPQLRVIALGGNDAGLRDAIDYQAVLDHPPFQADYRQHHYGDTCAILWTSGTTGRSKGVMQAHNNWIRSTLLGAGLMYHSRPGDIIYCALPLYNSGAWLTCIIRALMTGIGCVVEQKFSASRFMERIKHFNATQTFAVGAMSVFLMNTPEKDDDADNPLREACLAPIPPDKWQSFERRFGVRLLRSGMGQSECLLTLNQEHCDPSIDIPVYALGYPPPDADVRLFDDEGREVPDGQPGEICIRPLAPHILFNGYFGDPQATAEAYRGEWFLTGDLARKDPQTGAFFFVDRKKDAVRFAGRNISTLEVESVVLRHPAVREAAAFGIASDQLASEDELKLNVVLHKGQELSPEALCEFINKNAPHYFVPRYVEFVDALPYTPTNKVQKFALREAGISERTWDRDQSGFKVQKQ